MRITIQVPEADVPYVHVGTPATVRPLANPEPPLQAPVTRTTNAVDASSRTMLTEVWVPNHDHRLKPGMYVKVTLDLETHNHVLTVPQTAVAGGSVFVVDDETAQKVAVRTGFASGGRVEITGGLHAGDRVITSGPDGLSPGAPVRDLH